MGRSKWISGCVSIVLRPEAESQFPVVVLDHSSREWRRNWYFIRTSSVSPHLAMPSAPAERLAHSQKLRSQETVLAPAILRLAELHDMGLSGPMIIGDFVR